MFTFTKRLVAFLSRPKHAVLSKLDLATCALGQNKLDKAESYFREALEQQHNIVALQGLAQIKIRQGNLAAAQHYLDEAIRSHPDLPELHAALGEACLAQAHWEDATKHFQRTCALSPANPNYRFGYGICLQEAGHPNEAIQALEFVVQEAPDLEDARIRLGHIYLDTNRIDEALAIFNDMVTCRPNRSQAHMELAAALFRANQRKEALDTFQKAIECTDANDSTYLSYARHLDQVGETAMAITLLENRTQQQPSHECLCALATMLRQANRLRAASTAYRKAIDIVPKAELYNELGLIHEALGEEQDALDCYQIGLALQQDYFPLYFNLARYYSERDHFIKARKLYLQAIELDPNLSWARVNAAIMLYAQGLTNEAAQELQVVVMRDPTFSPAWRNLIMIALYQTDIDNAALFSLHQRFGSALASSQAHTEHNHLPEPEKRLRIGYLSSDFHDHPVSRNLLPLLQHQDRTRFETYIYHVGQKKDGLSEEMRRCTEEWRDVSSLSDEAIANSIQADNIDILITLAGRFDQNRPLVATYRPAPVNVSYHDPATSGLHGMDYIITDITLTPSDTTELFTERPFRLPTYYLHEPIKDAPEPNALPATTNGFITFGSFSNPNKINPDVIETWSRIMLAVPGARLILRFKNIYLHPDIRTRYLKLFEQNNIGADRLIFPESLQKRSQHLSLYHDVDVALDPFPFTGSTTTFEALWMGVPVVTLAGNRMVARWSASMLRRLDLTEFVATSCDDYVAIAQRLANNLPLIESLRSTLRDRVANSPLCDARRRAHQIERAYRYMWRKWCQEKTSPQAEGKRI